MADRGFLGLIVARLPGIGERERITLLESLSGERDLFALSARDVGALIGRPPSAGWNPGLARALAEGDEKAARLRGVGWVSWLDCAYPPLLREIYDPPAVLFFRGRLPDAERPLVAMVGTRRPSPAATAQAFDLAKGFGLAGVSVVSGLALGIDAMAHRGNVEGGAATFAVLGSGVDEVYPASNRPLARRALETGGGLISEYPPGETPRKWRFPARNRIVSGLCRGALVVEAPGNSGALITARFALEQNRDLWVASEGTRGDPRFDRRGTQRLADEGAEVVRFASDALRTWGAEARDPGFVRDSGGAARASSLARSLGVTL